MIKNLAGIRFPLFLIVFIRHLDYFQNKMHFPELNTLHWIFFTMSFFFILSGFCIGMNYCEKLSSFNWQNIGSFLRKRFLKLYPLYFITGLIGLIFLYLPQGQEWIYKFLFSYVPLICSWCPWAGHGGNDVGWFISALFFCYLLTPVLLYFIFKNKSFGKLVFAFIITFIISVILIATYGKAHIYRFYNIPLGRILEYTYGLIFGVLYKEYLVNKMNFQIKFKSIFDVLFLSTIFVVVYCIVTNNWYHLYQLEYWLYAPLICLFILYLCHEQKSILYNILENKIVLFFAGISLEMYLIHYPLMQIISKHVTISSNTMLMYLGFAIFALTILVSYAYQKLQKKVYGIFKIQ